MFQALTLQEQSAVVTAYQTRQIARWEFWQFIAVGITGFLLYKTLRATDRTARATEIADRAQLVCRVKVHGSSEGNWIFNPTIQNVGRTAALNVVYFSANTEKLYESFNEIPNNDRSNPLRRISVTSEPGDHIRAHSRAISQSIPEGEYRYFWIVATFTDVFDEHRWTGVVYRVDYKGAIDEIPYPSHRLTFSETAMSGASIQDAEPS